MKNFTIYELSQFTLKKRKKIYLILIELIQSLGYKRSKAVKRIRILERYISLIHYCKNKGGCKNCGEDNFALLEFDHIDMKSKNGNISEIIKQGTTKALFEELDKCNILCVKCHRLKTQEDLYHYRIFNKDFCDTHNIKNHNSSDKECLFKTVNEIISNI